MVRKITTLDLIRAIYKETSVFEQSNIQSSLKLDKELKAEFDLLNWSYKSLPKVQVSPKPDTLQRILRYSSRQEMLVG